MLRRVLRVQPSVITRNRDRSAFGHRVTGVDDQVYQRQLQCVDIDSHRPDVPVDIDHQLDIASGGGGEQISEFREALAQAYHSRD